MGRRAVLLSLLLGSSLAASAGATTLRRMGLEELTLTNDRVVVGRVESLASRWNADASFVLTDVTVSVSQVLRGPAQDGLLELTLMGGTIGATTVVIVAGAELAEGAEYLLFVSPSDLPGEAAHTSVRDHCQGAFDVVREGGAARALSQARTHPLLSDDRGVAEPPGGHDGFALADISREIRRIDAATRGGEGRR